LVTDGRQSGAADNQCTTYNEEDYKTDYSVGFKLTKNKKA